MKRTIGKTVVTLLVAMLVASSMLVLQAGAQNGDGVITTASLGVAPNPVGVGQQILCTMWIQPDPPEGEVFTGLTIIVTKPDETDETIGPFNTNTEGVYYFTYRVDQIGEYSFQLHFPGNWYDETIYYLPSDSEDIKVIVQEEPGIPVIPGEDVTVNPDPADLRVSLTFEEVLTPGIATTIWKSREPPEGVPELDPIIGFYYDFEVTFEFRGIVKVGIPYDEALLDGAVESKLTLWHYEIIGDVNGDGKVNLKDILMIKLALGTKRGNRRWNPACDLNSDGKVNLQDLVLAIRNFGKTASAWRNITTWVDTVNNIVYGETPNFPPFGVRR